MSKISRILLLYKRSAYRIYFESRDSSIIQSKNKISKKEIVRLKNAHDAHYKTLKFVSKILLTGGLNFDECYRGKNIDFSPYDLIITVGGDGTFLEAARKSSRQILLGVNSSPIHSVGRLCAAHIDNFEFYLNKIISGKYNLKYLHRLQLKFQGKEESYFALNDVLICHKSPAALCRSIISVNGMKEEQRNSGVWISTAVGSTGAINSAGGKVLSPYDNKFQYLPREIYRGNGSNPKLKGGVLHHEDKIQITSLMRQGMIYLDGAHQNLPFFYGSKINIRLSTKPIKIVSVKK